MAGSIIYADIKTMKWIVVFIVLDGFLIVKRFIRVRGELNAILCNDNNVSMYLVTLVITPGYRGRYLADIVGLHEMLRFFSMLWIIVT